MDGYNIDKSVFYEGTLEDYLGKFYSYMNVNFNLGLSWYADALKQNEPKPMIQILKPHQVISKIVIPEMGGNEFHIRVNLHVLNCGNEQKAFVMGASRALNRIFFFERKDGADWQFKEYEDGNNE
jgi:hypothetical protein